MADAERFTWDEMDSDAPMPLLSRQRVIGAKSMVSRVVLEAGCQVPSHAHENEQISCVVEGELRMHVGDPARTVTLRAGDVLLIPSNLPHGAEALRRTVVFDIFSPPSERTGIDAAGTERGA